MNLQKSSPLSPAAAVPASPEPVRWSPARPATAPQRADGADWARPGLTVALARGLVGACPCCGKGRVFRGWLTQVDACSACHAPLGAAPADDAPPYFVIFIVAHLVIGAQVVTDAWLHLPLVSEAAIFLPLTLFLCMALLRPVKGATVGLMMQLGIVQQAPIQP